MANFVITGKAEQTDESSYTIQSTGEVVTKIQLTLNMPGMQDRVLCEMEESWLVVSANAMRALGFTRSNARPGEKEVERITAKCRRYQEQGKQVPRWVRAGMDERFRRVEQVEQRIQMLLGIFASHGVLPLEFKPAYSVGDLLLQHLDALEQEAEEKGGVQQVLADHFAKVYKASLPLAA